MAVRAKGQKWLAWQLSHRDLDRAREQVADRGKDSLKFSRLEVTSGLLWLETAAQEAPQYLADVVPERKVRWSTQVVPCSLSDAQALISTPLAGACSWITPARCITRHAVGFAEATAILCAAVSAKKNISRAHQHSCTQLHNVYADASVVSLLLLSCSATRRAERDKAKQKDTNATPSTALAAVVGPVRSIFADLLAAVSVKVSSRMHDAHDEGRGAGPAELWTPLGAARNRKATEVCVKQRQLTPSALLPAPCMALSGARLHFFTYLINTGRQRMCRPRTVCLVVQSGR